MHFILFGIVCSVSVGILLKLVRRYNPNIKQIILFNYAFAILLSYMFFAPEIPAWETAPWQIYIPLGIMLPGVFLVLAASIKYMGIVKTDAAQRMSLCIPLLAAWLLFGEVFSTAKIIGLAIGVPALVMVLWKKTDHEGRKWIYPAVVMLGFGFIDILFKQVALFKKIPYTSSLFVIFSLALIITAIVVLHNMWTVKTRITMRDAAVGVLLGALNFGNIYFYLRAHAALSESPSTVFAMMNIGVITLGSIVGVLAFNEKLSWLNYAGLGLAGLSILVIALYPVS